MTALPENAMLASTGELVRQKTLHRSATLLGKGVHFGEAVRLSVHPAPENHGIVFVRTDLPGSPAVPASLAFLAHDDLLRRTTLRAGSTEVHTVEHLLSAMHVLGVTNARIELDGPELPLLDGSSLPFVDALMSAGLVEQEAVVPILAARRPLAFTHEKAEYAVVPATDFRVTFFFTSAEPLLRSQSASFVITPESYAAEIAPARTFAFFQELEMLRRRGLIRGGSLASAVVIGRKAILNPSLRFPDEPVRHKILDFIGDLALLGCPLRGHFLAWRAGHRANAAFATFLRKELLS